MIRRLAAAALLAVAVHAPATPQQPERAIRFERGATSVVVPGALARGQLVRYRVRAREGQRMTVRVRSEENNAVFQLHGPRRTGPLPGARDGDDARRWSGRLPASGEYRIVVGATRGGAEFDLHVSIR